MRTTAEMRHWASVKASLAVLEKLKKDGEIFDYVPVKDNSPLDLQGVDIRILMKRKNGSVFEIPVQVKSSMHYVNQHYAREGQWIDAVCNEKDLIEQFLDIIDKHTSAGLKTKKHLLPEDGGTLDISYISRLLRVTPQAIYGAISRKRIPVIERAEKGNKRYIVPATPLTYWLDERIAGTQKRLSRLKAAKSHMQDVGGNVPIEIRDVARLLDITTQSVYGIISRKRIPVDTQTEEGKNRHRIPALSLIQWLDKRIAQAEKSISVLLKAKNIISRIQEA